MDVVAVVAEEDKNLVDTSGKTNPGERKSYYTIAF
jgi:hypothetical protein